MYLIWLKKSRVAGAGVAGVGGGSWFVDGIKLRILEMNRFKFSRIVGCCYLGFPGGSNSKASACNEGDLGSIPGLGRSPGEGNGDPLQYSCLDNSKDRGAW